MHSGDANICTVTQVMSTSDTTHPLRTVAGRGTRRAVQAPRGRRAPPPALRLHPRDPRGARHLLATQGPSWGYLKSQFLIDLVNFWR